jgi:hypothetical protein
MNATILPSTDAHSANELQDETQLVDDAATSPHDSMSKARGKITALRKISRQRIDNLLH